MAKEALKVENLMATAGNLKLSIKTLSVEIGKVTCVMGPNGSGKTTLLKALSGLISSMGEIKVFGKDARSKRRDIAYISQEPNLFRGSVFSNIAYPLKLRGLKGKEIKEKVIAVAKKFKIDDLLSKNSYTLSGGEARKVSIARALVYEPKLLLLDEPLNNLDKESTSIIFKDLKTLLGKKETTAVYVSHSNEETLSLGDDLVFIDKGKIIQCGQVLKVMSQPSTKTAADYLETENIFDANITGWNNGLAEVRIDNMKVSVSSNIKKGKVFLCLRPEDVFISRNELGKMSARNCYAGKVKEITDKGSFINLTVDCGIIINAYITKQSVEELVLKDGSKVNLYFKATAAHLISRN